MVWTFIVRISVRDGDLGGWFMDDNSGFLDSKDNHNCKLQFYELRFYLYAFKLLTIYSTFLSRIV